MALTSPDVLWAWRVQCFEDLGFSTEEADLLADAKTYAFVKTKRGLKAYESPLHHANVAKMLRAGCTYQQVIDIFT